MSQAERLARTGWVLTLLGIFAIFVLIVFNLPMFVFVIGLVFVGPGVVALTESERMESK